MSSTRSGNTLSPSGPSTRAGVAWRCTRISLAAGTAVLLGGCFVHVPADRGAVPPGSAVQVQLNNDGSDRFTAETGRRGSAVTGVLLRDDENAVELSASLQGIESTVGATPGAVTLRFPSNEVRGISVRTLSPTRTAAVAAGGVVGVALLFRAVGGWGRDGGLPDDGGGGVFLLRFPVPIGW